MPLDLPRPLGREQESRPLAQGSLPPLTRINLNSLSKTNLQRPSVPFSLNPYLPPVFSGITPAISPMTFTSSVPVGTTTFAF
jgi:hypothetical protein